MRLLIAFQVLAAVSLGLSGCEGDPPESAGAEPTGERIRCVEADEGGGLVIHPGTLTRPGVEVVKADLSGAEGIEAVERVAVDWTGNPDVQGMSLKYPPDEIADSLADWDKRRPLVGTQVPAGRAQAVLFALRLTDPTTPGRLDGVRVRLIDGQEPRDRLMLQSLVVKPHDDPCTLEDFEVLSSTGN